MTTPVIDLDGYLVGREHTLTELRFAVADAELTGGGCVLVSGAPGVGKSTVIQAFGTEVSARDCIFAYGRCRENAPAPYSALGDALRTIVATMEGADHAERDRWRADLVAGTSMLAGILGDLVPQLAETLGPGRPIAEVDAADARRRLHRAVIRLIASTTSFRPVIVAIDDLQWADRDTLLLLSELLAASVRNCLVLGAHRTSEFDAPAAGLTGPRIKAIELDPLSKVDIERLLTAVSGQGIDLADVADEVRHRTGGNPLQVRQLVYRAQREGALIPVGRSGNPTWDLRALAAMDVAATTAEFFSRYLDQLRPADRAILSLLACTGGEFDLADAAAATGEPPDVVASAMWSAMELRLLEALDEAGRRITNAITRDARYRFSHDRVAEAAREGVTETTRRGVHLRMARRLLGIGDTRLFEAARHVGLGGPGLTDHDERVAFAEVLRKAAARARAQASFPLALEYSRNGLELLGPRRWTDDFALARALQLDAAEAALLAGDATALHTLLDEAERAMHDPADRARITYLRLKGRVAQNRLQEAVELGLAALAELGERLPPDAGKPRMAKALAQLKLTMTRWDNERLLRLPHCRDWRIIEIQRILAELHSLSYIARPNLFPLIVRKQLALTLAHGHTPSSPLAFASYGLLLVLTGDRAGSQRFGEIGVELADQPEFRSARPQTVFMYVNFIRHWRHPVRDGLHLLREAVTEALDQGDQEYAGFLTAVLLTQYFWVGHPLAEIDVLARTLLPEIGSQPVPSRLCQATLQLCLNLMGRGEDTFLLAGESGYDERDVLPAALEEQDMVALAAAATIRLGLHFWAGDYAGACRVAPDAFTYIGGMAGTCIEQHVYLDSVMSKIHHAPDTRSTARDTRRALALHRKWAEDAPANYAAPHALIEGSWARVRGHDRAAERALDRAIMLAEQHQLPMVAALAYEEAAALYQRTGRGRLAEDMLWSAYQRWLSVGMTARTERLAQTNPRLLSRDLVPERSAGIDPVGAHQVMRALSSARTPEALADIVLRTVSTTTSAHRVLLFAGDHEHATVTAVHESGTTSIVDGPWIEVRYDHAKVRQAMETGVPSMDTGTPMTPGGHATPPADSILLVPIRMQDKTIGLIHAERAAAFGPLTTEHQEAVTFLCAQAAAPLWSFRLESQLRAADEYRQSLMDVQARFVPNELLKILDIDDIRRVRSGYRVERRMTVLISDIRGYTTMLEDMNVSEASNLAMGFLRAVELPIISCNGMIQDVRGDEIVAVFESETDAVRAGLAMLRSLREHNRERAAVGSEELRAGIGINTGMVGVGLVGGVNRMVLTIIGDAVNLAARVESASKRYGSALLISGATLSGLPSPEEFDIRRMERVLVVNRRKPVTIHEVYDEDPEPLRSLKRAAAPAFAEAFALFDSGDAAAARAAFERARQLLPDDTVATLHLAHCAAVERGELSPGQDVPLTQK